MIECGYEKQLKSSQVTPFYGTTWILSGKFNIIKDMFVYIFSTLDIYLKD